MTKFRLFLFFSLCFGICHYSYAQEKLGESIIVNGDTVEYSMDNKEVSAIGNVSVIYKGSKLTCDKLTVNTETKEGVAEGNARLEDQKGVIEGKKITYNFETKTGTMIDSEFRANPYFGRAQTVEKVSENEIVTKNSYATTCSLDDPHYRLKSKQINLFPGDKIQTRGTSLFVKDAPMAYLPWYSHSLKDPFMHVRVMPGKNKDWGAHMLTAWRYNLTENLDGRIYLDYRDRLGVAEGFGANYNTNYLGRGDFKFYYTQEKDKKIKEDMPSEFQRYFARLRHRWDIDGQTTLTSEVYKISDEKRKIYDPQAAFLKDYFYREYEKDSQPLTYALLHHFFRYSSFDLLIQKRTNHWFDQIEKLPELKYSLPSLKIGETPLYFENSSSLANLDKKASISPVTPGEEDVTRFDTTNKLSLPTKASIFWLSPFVSSRQTVYDKGADGDSLPVRTMFSSGVDVSTKFYRIFDVKSAFFGMDINGLRHIITPSIGYAYNHEPTIVSSKLRQIDTVDSITRGNSATLELTNKLQTKRGGQSVDLVDLKVNSSYLLKPKTGDKLGSNLSDILCELKILPYSWLRIESDAIYERSGNRSDANYNKFSNANYDINLDFAEGRSFGIGQRYQRKGGNEIIYSFNWRLNPKWGFSFYHRIENGHDPLLQRGLKEQEYVISRDLHCWAVDLSLNSKKNEGNSIWVVFRLKAFPETEFGFNQSYNKPKSGSQSNP
jgi:LPS-assembly protein